MLEMRHIDKTYRGRKTVPVLQDFSMTVKRGETVVLMGRSGSGKSTVARILLLLERPDRGGIYDNGEEVKRDSRSARAFRKNVQYISQHPESFFDPYRKLADSIRETGRIHHLEDAVVRERMGHLLEQAKIHESVLDRYPYQVSGGEIQRVAVCRALLLQPGYLVLDEATSMLDVSVQAQILNLLKELQRTEHLGYLFISHESEVVDWFTEGVPGKRIVL